MNKIHMGRWKTESGTAEWCGGPQSTDATRLLGVHDQAVARRCKWSAPARSGFANICRGRGSTRRYHYDQFKVFRTHVYELHDLTSVLTYITHMCAADKSESVQPQPHVAVI
ncbi:hypothetical protein J6590_080216 [Homalodisca vitripennis]|nr:hypothetical protein J6590_080216 [Homalodisca vitripennis]